MNKAACKGVSRDSDFDPFFPGGNNDLLAIALVEYCSHCKVRTECDEWATAMGIEHGVWGGKKRTPNDS